MSDADNNEVHREYLFHFVVFDSNASQAYSLIPLPANAPFELRETTDGRGWGAFATRRIRKGAVILEELPQFVIEATKVFPGSRHLEQAFANLPPPEKALVELARDNGGPEFTSSSLWFIQNSFNINHTELGFYLTQSRFNHSCVPNSSVPYTEHRDMAAAWLTRVALEDIEVGEEITFSYQPGLVTKTKAERHSQLFFECRCECCTLHPSFSQLSDRRRHLMAQLDYLAFGALRNGQIDRSENPIISDPGLKKAAEDRTLPITSQIFYHMLHIVIAEYEQVANDSLISTLRGNVLRLAYSLRTGSNIEMAARALTQVTFQKQLEVASRFFGLPDDGDDELNEWVSQMRAALMEDYLEDNS
ncbi:hypothetical protein CEP54_001275 [Fusarium duplospermum]|uniref:SET domain-containing protein n=1 Tax=Fusarium duplospermum TaxID=1325734 RepID=A0A428R1Z4_9HYPO|nr:hypothetical protein CEP54_001275 [Fusarium duplospermum]